MTKLPQDDVSRILALIDAPDARGRYLREVLDAPPTESGMDRLMRDIASHDDESDIGDRWDGLG